MKPARKKQQHKSKKQRKNKQTNQSNPWKSRLLVSWIVWAFVSLLSFCVSPFLFSLFRFHLFFFLCFFSLHDLPLCLPFCLTGLLWLRRIPGECRTAKAGVPWLVHPRHALARPIFWGNAKGPNESVSVWSIPLFPFLRTEAIWGGSNLKKDTQIAPQILCGRRVCLLFFVVALLPRRSQHTRPRSSFPPSGW